MNSRCSADRGVTTAKECYDKLVTQTEACSNTFSFYSRSGRHACWCITKSATDYVKYDDPFCTSYHPPQGFAALIEDPGKNYGPVVGTSQCWVDGNHGAVCSGTEDQVWLCHYTRHRGAGYNMNSRCSADKGVTTAKECYDNLVTQTAACSDTFSFYSRNGKHACWCITKSATDYVKYDDPYCTSYHPQGVAESISAERTALLEKALNSKSSLAVESFAVIGFMAVLWMGYAQIKAFANPTYRQIAELDVSDQQI